jgi:hypothetical protein
VLLILPRNRNKLRCEARVSTLLTFATRVMNSVPQLICEQIWNHKRESICVESTKGGIRKNPETFFFTRMLIYLRWVSGSGRTRFAVDGNVAADLRNCPFALNVPS